MLGTTYGREIERPSFISYTAFSIKCIGFSAAVAAIKATRAAFLLLSLSLSLSLLLPLPAAPVVCIIKMPFRRRPRQAYS